MALSDYQIERYSRQILVVGGIAQERLLASRVALAGLAKDVAPALRYLVGAGVRQLSLDLPGEVQAAYDELVALAGELDPGVVIEREAPSTPASDLRLVIIGTGEILAAAGARRGAAREVAVVVRLDTPPRILVQPPRARPAPELETEMFASWAGALAGAEGASQAGFVTMVAVTEALKQLMQGVSEATAGIIEFAGYQARRRIPGASP